MHPESQQLLKELEQKYPVRVLIPVRGSAKTTIEWAKQLEYALAHNYIQRLRNGEELAKSDWEEAKDELLAYAIGGVEIDPSTLFKTEVIPNE